MEFLSKRNPFDIHQSEWVFMLMDMQDIFGDKVTDDMAGFYLFCLEKEKMSRAFGEGFSVDRAVRSTFAHDYNSRKQAGMLPRVSGYSEYWLKEVARH